MRAPTEKYADVPAAELTFELDFSSNRSIYSSDLLITDWSAIAYEFCFSTKRPVLFVNTKIKMENPDYRDIPDIRWRYPCGMRSADRWRSRSWRTA